MKGLLAGRSGEEYPFCGAKSEHDESKAREASHHDTNQARDSEKGFP